MLHQEPLEEVKTECENILQAAQQIVTQQQIYQQKKQSALLRWGAISLAVAVLLILLPLLGANKATLMKIGIGALVLGSFSLIRSLQDGKNLQGVQTLQKRIQRFFRNLITGRYQPKDEKKQASLTWVDAYKSSPRPVFMGVAAYLAKQLGVSVRLLRLLFFIAFFISGGSVIFLYILVGLLLAFVKDE